MSRDFLQLLSRNFLQKTTDLFVTFYTPNKITFGDMHIGTFLICCTSLWFTYFDGCILNKRQLWPSTYLVVGLKSLSPYDSIVVNEDLKHVTVLENLLKTSNGCILFFSNTGRLHQERCINQGRACRRIRRTSLRDVASVLTPRSRGRLAVVPRFGLASEVVRLGLVSVSSSEGLGLGLASA